MTGIYFMSPVEKILTGSRQVCHSRWKRQHVYQRYKKYISYDTDNRSAMVHMYSTIHAWKYQCLSIGPEKMGTIKRQTLTQCGLVTPYMASQNLVHIRSDNGLLPNGTKPLPKPMSINHHWEFVAFTWGQFHRKCSNCPQVNVRWIWYQSFIWVWTLLIWDYSRIPRHQWVNRMRYVKVLVLNTNIIDYTLTDADLLSFEYIAFIER